MHTISSDKDNDSEQQRTVAEFLFYLPRKEQRIQLEVFRAQHALKHGPADLTRRYVSTWPPDQQKWLFENQPQKWFDGLPSFVQAFLCEKVCGLLRAGELDLHDPKHRNMPWIQFGEAEENRLDPYWVEQYLGGEIGRSEKSQRHR